MNDATQILKELAEGDESAAERLMPLVYAELRALAQHYFQIERSNHTLEPTALVHEAFLRMVDQTRVQWESRTHFFATAATAMRRILTDHARRRRAIKRGGDRRRDRVPLSQADQLTIRTPLGQHDVDVADLDERLAQLAELDERQYRIVELRFFGGLSVAEVSTILQISESTIEREWRMARAWLSSALRTGNRT